MFKSFPINKAGRDFVVGDIHGCFSELAVRLVGIGFNPDCDRLFSVGDLVDRGPESRQADEWVKKPWFHAVMGNHDDMAVRWPNGFMPEDNYRVNGGGWNIDRGSDLQIATSKALSDLPYAIEVATKDGLVGIVHAECIYRSWDQFRDALNGTTSLSKSNLDHVTAMTMWARERISSRDDSHISGVRAIVCGHTPVQTPIVLGNVHYIDTGAVFGRGFTILDLATLEPV